LITEKLLASQDGPCPGIHCMYTDSRIPFCLGTAPVSTTAILRPGPPVQTSQLQQALNPTRTGQQIRVAPSLVTTVGRMTAPTIATVNSVIANKVK
jgi:hypothetical protein